MSPSIQRVTNRNATFQQWQALLGNRTKRHRAGEFIVQGVRPISLALEHDWDFAALLRPVNARPTRWAEEVWRTAPGRRFELADELLAELAERDAEDHPELVAVVRMPADDLDRLAQPSWSSDALSRPELAESVSKGGEGRAYRDPPPPLIVVFDRPSGPGNIGTLVRSMDAFGATGLIVAGHAADPYDPRAVRASTGSLFAVPTVRVSAAFEVVEWVAAQREAGVRFTVVGTDEGGETDLRSVDLAGPTVLVIGNETRGMSNAWREACDHLLSIPMVGSASSLNAATAGSIILHEALCQRLRA